MRRPAEYMTLPASQYSVLDAKRIERIDDDTFRCAAVRAVVSTVMLAQDVSNK